ncbi:OmpA family protein [Psychroflexus planctonicus]|uniref:Cell envelope biogenesis protein OmpA n=1 Tax=Psychroflexus planctonicus TaxID=1526575 RepID=A0ABQ1SAU9_9FLAO|nr:OmpA family protein [Psychroflexus planctonicus]GGE23455.1 cell envelope biogenesis protein OmpA [Psychroflexus planctonicus]
MKNNAYVILILAVITLLQSPLYAQVDRLEEADKKFERFAFIDAQEIYLEVAEAGYKSENLFKKLGDSYYFNGDLVNAEKWYTELFALQPELSKEYYYRYAQALRSVEKYEDADQLMLQYDELSETEDSRVKRIKQEKNYLELIELQSGKFDIDSTNINSKLSDFAPAFFGDKLIFASNRETSSAVKRIHEWNNQPYLNLYQVSIDEDFKPVGSPEAFAEELTSKFHEASATFTKDGKTIYFTRNNFTDNKYKESEEGINYLKIYRSEFDPIEKTWSKPVELPFNSDEFTCAHPALSPDEKQLYFASDMEGSLGMSDIFVVDINEDGSYGEPKNLGKEINTEGRETFPFVSDNGLLFFSSNGHIGLGGLDVFVAVIKKDGTYGEVFNLGRPINSSKDDFSFIINSKMQAGFFSSNRDDEGGTGSDNIYKFKQNEDLITECQQYLSGTISKVNSEAGIPNVKVDLFDEELNFLESTQTNEQGEYTFSVECDKRFVVRVSKEGFITFEELIRSGNAYEDSFKQNLQLEEGDDLGVTQAGKGDDLRNILQLDPIYFDLDKSNIRQDAEVELQKVIAVLKSYPEMKIDVRSHTDSRAGDAYNKILSEKRAKSTVAYIAEKGISANRVSGKGYGETQLVNNCSNNVDCTEEEHALNRRSEFIILNENETPGDVRKKISDKTKASQQQEKNRAKENDNQVGKAPKKIAESPAQSTGNQYNFEAESPEEVFTVQIGAFGIMSDVKFNLPDVFSHAYSDGYKRYFSGIFTTREEADKHKAFVRANGAEGAFVVGLQGEERF